MVGSLRGRMVRQIARLATFGWFRTVDRSGLEDIDEDRPILVIANHGGGFVDPALLVAAFPRYPRALAMATLWRTPARPFLWLAGAIPVHRAADGATGANLQTFAACHRVLADRGVVAIFPEGQASDAPHLLPVHTGAARIALGARAHGAGGLSVIAVGLIYEDKASARARAYVRAGEPLDLDAWVVARGRETDGIVVDDADRRAVAALTEELRARLASVALDFENIAELTALNEAAEIARRPIDADPDGPRPWPRARISRPRSRRRPRRWSCRSGVRSTGTRTPSKRMPSPMRPSPRTRDGIVDATSRASR